MIHGGKLWNHNSHTAPLNGTLRQKFSSPSDPKVPRHEGVGPSGKASLGGQTGG